MEKQRIALGVIITLVCSAIMISGCTQQNSSINQNNNISIDTVEQILQKVQLIESVYYEMNITHFDSGEPVLYTDIKIWQKTPYLKENVSHSYNGTRRDVSYIKRSNGTYQYDTNENMYRSDYDPPVVLPQPSIDEIIEDLLNNQTLTILGTDTVDGQTTTVIQYSSNESENLMTMKLWIWNEKGVPLKATETRDKEGNTLKWEYRYLNYSFVDIPDSTFDVT